MKNSPLKVVTILGTRPEIIRLSSVMKLLDKFVTQIIIHTGQNYDYELNEIFFKDLELRKPDYFLAVDTSSLGRVYGETLIKTEEVLLKEKPDAVLILGDTNSSIAAIIAKRMRIPIFHMEAGNRSFDLNVPEEINRRIIDHIADFNLVYTEHARRHLLSEGLPHRRIYLTGSPLFEVLNEHKEKINASTILQQLGLTEKQYFLVSTHREENVDNPEHLQKILTILNRLAEDYQLPVIVSTHPRTRKRLDSFKNCTMSELIQFLKPFSFSDYVHLQIHAKCTLSDSGTISEESAILSFPAISMRQSMERPEAQDAGTIVLTGFEADIVLNSVATVIGEHEQSIYSLIPEEYQIENTSWRVLKLILGNAGLSNLWWGVENLFK
ncbi:MAG: UDP-N-acetylglucosamine 2-epimerase (non-hydrolyzing) [Desulfobacterales bacterium]|nr:UDP-N-acetylglucosamine 2-epimerase (non-hydrolyzing) [Desulfobacterales bacterium]